MEGGHPRTAANIFSCLQYPLEKGRCGRDGGNEASQGGTNSSAHTFFLQGAMPRAGMSTPIQTSRLHSP